MKINLSENFPQLSRAPIVEAVLDLRAKPSVQWDQEAFKQQLKEVLPDYPKIEAQRAFKGEIKAGVGQPPEQRVIDLGWNALRFRSADKLQVAQFRKDGFAFSRLKPYQNWNPFTAEALRLWGVFVKVMRPEAIQRVGVRFINRISFPADGFSLEDYFLSSPQPLVALGLVPAGFLYRDTLIVPETGYKVNLVRTIQPPEGTPPSLPVILDIDVFINSPMELDDTALRQRLGEMRWLKNKVFFGSVTRKAKGIIQ
jgi:uncharacterized protein (TIGR04255 family)